MALSAIRRLRMARASRARRGGRKVTQLPISVRRKRAERLVKSRQTIRRAQRRQGITSRTRRTITPISREKRVKRGLGEVIRQPRGRFFRRLGKKVRPTRILGRPRRARRMA